MQPTSILGDVRGFARDYALDALPRGYVWDLVDYIPRRRGAKLDCRGPWEFLSPASLGGPVWGGYHAPFRAGTSLLVATNPALYEVNPATGVPNYSGEIFATGKQNGVMLEDRVWFADGTGASRPKRVTRSGTTLALAQNTAGPNGSVLAVYKNRLIVAGDPGNPERLYFSETEDLGGAVGAWDALSVHDSGRAVTGLWPMSSQVLIFHDGSIEKLRGSIPPGTDRDNDDMGIDSFTEQIGCNDPASIVGWQENVIWAAPRGVYLSDGSTIRSLTQQGSIGDLWRTLYANKRAGTQVHAAVFLDMLFVSVLTDWTSGTPSDLRPFTLVCSLTDRSWFRFANMGMTAAIPSNLEGEEIWWSPDGYGYAASYGNRLAKLSPTLFIERDPIDLLDVSLLDHIPEDAIDGNGVAVLPQVETSFQKLGPEGVKRARSVHISHTTIQATPSNTNLLRVSYRMRPWPFTPYTPIGDIPGKDDYKRNRLRLGKRGYGVAIKVEQIVPSYLSRLHDIGVEEWAQDRGKL